MSSGFVSEADLAEKRKVKRENWQKNRGKDDPEEPPEDPEVNIDRRTLFEKLQEQKDKKQEEWDDAHKLKNMVRGLEDEEVGFLELVDETKLREENRIKKEEKSALEEYRQKVADRQIKWSRAALNAQLDVTKKPDDRIVKNKQSQMSLMAGAIKRKFSEGEESEKKTMKVKTTREESRRCIAILPGIGEYTDSSASDSDSSSSTEITNSDVTGRGLRNSSSSS